jgi:hypothetical protein
MFVSRTEALRLQPVASAPTNTTASISVRVGLFWLSKLPLLNRLRRHSGGCGKPFGRIGDAVIPWELRNAKSK